MWGNTVTILTVTDSDRSCGSPCALFAGTAARSEEGRIGVGTSTGGESAAFIIEKHLAMFVEGQNVRNISYMWDQMFRASIHCAGITDSVSFPAISPIVSSSPLSSLSFSLPPSLSESLSHSASSLVRSLAPPHSLSPFGVHPAPPAIPPPIPTTRGGGTRDVTPLISSQNYVYVRLRAAGGTELEGIKQTLSPSPPRTPHSPPRGAFLLANPESQIIDASSDLPPPPPSRAPPIPIPHAV